MIDNRQARQDLHLVAARPQNRRGATQGQETGLGGLDGIDRLLDRELPAEYRREWTERVAAATSEVAPGIRSVVIFRIGVEWLALPTQIVQEVAEECVLHGIPHHHGGVLVGLASVRGNLLICASLGAVLGLEESRRASSGRLLLINHQAGPLALPVDEVCGVHRYHPRDLKEIPATLSHAASMYASGLLSWQEKTVGCLDAELVLYALNKGLI